jgi:ribosome-associated protein
MPMSEDAGPIRLAPTVLVPRSRIAIRAVGAGGPGGQHVNKTASACELRIAVSELGLPEEAAERLRMAASHWLTGEDDLLIVSSVTRSFRANREDCIERLATLVRDSLIRPKRRRPTKPSRGSIQRRLNAKSRSSDLKRSREWRPDEH